MLPWTAFQREVETLLATVVPSAKVAAEVPKDRSMGDLALACFAMAKERRQAPQAIATELAAACEAQPRTWVASAVAAGPYVNFRIDRARLAKEFLADPAAGLQPEPKAEKILLEHTSANPNGPLHVGRARNPILGDTLGRIFRAAGYEVETQYYMDNLGRQVALLYWGKHNIDPATMAPAERDKADHDLVRYYQAANEKMRADPAIAAEVASLVARLETADGELLAGVREVYEACFAGMQESLSRLGVAYDSIKDESDLVQNGDVDATIDGLCQSPRYGKEPDGAQYLDLAAELEGSQSTKFFFTRKDGTSVYATRDVAYHAWKAKQVGAGRLVDVLGEDHRLQSLQVGIALDELGLRRPEVVFYAFVSLPEGKMSTRANRVVFVDDLLDEAVERARAAIQAGRGVDEAHVAEAVGIGAIRFNIARVQPEKPIQFRWEDALNFDGDSAPYLMYAHARAASILEKAVAAPMGVPGEGEERLVAVLSRYALEVEAAAAAMAPHRLCAYALEVATAFNAYYRDNRVVDADESVRGTRIAAVQAAKLTLGRCMEAVGVPILDRM